MILALLIVFDRRSGDRTPRGAAELDPEQANSRTSFRRAILRISETVGGDGRKGSARMARARR